MAGDQLKPDDGAAAVAKHKGWFAADGSQQAMSIVSEDLDNPLVLWQHFERAVREASRILCHNGVPVGKPRGNTGEDRGVRRAARDHEQHRP